MRNPLTMVREAYRSPQNGAVIGSVDDLRQRVLQTNALVHLALVSLSMPISAYMALQSEFSMALHMVPLGIVALLSWQAARTGNLMFAIVLQVVAMASLGLCVTMADGANATVGIGIGAIAALYGYLLGDRKSNKWTLGVSLLFAGGQIMSLLVNATPAAPASLLLPSFLMPATYLLVSVGIIGLSLLRMRQAFFAYSKSQMRAFKHLVESVQDVVAKYSTDGELAYLSHTAEGFFGCKRYELVGTGFMDRVHVLDRPHFLKAMNEARMLGVPRSVEMRMQRLRNGQPHFLWVESSLSPVNDADSKEGRYEVIAILRDITQRKDQEAATQKAHTAAENANQSKSRFLATIGHELRTPLNAVVGFSDMMLADIGGELTKDHQEYVSLIRQSGTHLLDTVNMLLDMSKIEAGKFELQADEIEPGQLVDPCFAIVASAAQAKQINLAVDKPKHLPTMVADERACRQILINLLSNAIKFSPHGATVRVRIRPVGTRIEFSVIDQGIGISKTDIDRIGEPFFQANNGLDRHYEGTGLGLSIVQGLTELHGGEFKIQSTLDKGTTMFVLLPIEARKPDMDVSNKVEEMSDHRFLLEAAKVEDQSAEQQKAVKAS